MSDLLGQSKKDPAMVLGGSGRARSSVQLGAFFKWLLLLKWRGGGLDPLESLLKKEQKEPEDEGNAEEFDRRHPSGALVENDIENVCLM